MIEGFSNKASVFVRASHRLEGQGISPLPPAAITPDKL
ncbi:MAG: hypothetical protein FD155_1956 [Bacteroidetes bacterium]|nr:MAG: hypothetical protein FD155_1956 [Bacteroidota bacterium]